MSQQQQQAAPAAPAIGFKPYGSPPQFDFDEFKDTFELWHRKWNIFLALSTIDSVLPEADRPLYKANTLLSCLSTSSLQTVLSMGLTDANLKDHEEIIKRLRERCNAGRNCHVWRQKFASHKQRADQSVDDWLCELRDLARKSDFGSDCCAACEPTRILGQVVYGVHDPNVRVELLKQGAALTLDQALTIVRTAEATSRQAANITCSDTTPIQQVHRSAHKRGKGFGGPPKSRPPATSDRKPSSHVATPGCFGCGALKRCEPGNCPALGKKCNKCGKLNHFAPVCKSSAKRIDIISLKHCPAGAIASVSSSDMVTFDIQPDQCHASISLPALPDTGAEIDAIPDTTFVEFFPDIRLQRGSQPTTAIGSLIPSLGTFRASISWSTDGATGQPVNTIVHVLKGLRQAVVSKATQIALGMLPPGYPHVPAKVVNNSHVSAVHAAHTFFPGLAAHVITPVPVPVPVIQVVETPTSEARKAADMDRIKSMFPTTFDGQCRPMNGAPCHFVLKEGVRPVSMRGSRPVAEPLMPRLKEELDALEQQGIIRKVSAPTAWVHPIVLVPKKDNGIRLCVDFRALNENIVRPKFESMTPFQAVRTIPPGMMYFTVVDALKGYHQVPLDDESADLTTFSTPMGRYQYRRLPFGITHAGDDYCRRVADVFDDIPNSRRVVEDILVFSRSYDEHVEQVRSLVARANEHNISLNVKKLVFAQPSVKFGGFIVDASGFRPDPELTRAIREFPVPQNITDLRSFFGLCQQVGNFSDQIAAALEPLSPLLKRSYIWEWTTTHDAAFCNARKTLSSIPDLAFYDQTHPTALHVDASRLRGLGFVLKQLKPDNQWRMVQAGSRFLSSAESRYAMIELECLGAAWAMSKCQQFIEGLQSFELVTDHKPLVPILNDYSLDKLDNPRLLRLRLKMQRFSFTARWVPGKSNVDADALSRAPVDDAVPADEIAEGPPSFSPRLSLLCAIEGSELSVVDPVLEKVRAAAAVDPVMIQLKDMIINGFPNNKCNLPLPLRPFWDVHDRLAIDESDGVIVFGARVVIPHALRRDIIKDLLLLHQGATKLRQRARLSLYWPGMDGEIASAATTCDECVKTLPSNPPEPMQPHEPAVRPFEQIHADLCTVNGKHYLVLVDQLSGWPHVTAFNDVNTSTKKVIESVRAFFSTVGVPVKFWSDNGPQFASTEFKKFLSEWGVSAGTSSPHYAQSNGRAEVEVKVMKKLIKGSSSPFGVFDENKFAKSIMLFRNTPRLGGASPAQRVFGHPIRDSLPIHRRAFATEWHKADDVLEKRERRAKSLQAEHYNRTTRLLPPLTVGNHVLIQHPVSKLWATPGIIVEAGPNRDFLIKTPAGRVIRRNRRFLRRRVPVFVNHAPPVLTDHSPPAPLPAAARSPAVPAMDPVPAQPRRSRRQKKNSKKYPASEWTA